MLELFAVLIGGLITFYPVDADQVSYTISFSIFENNEVPLRIGLLNHDISSNSENMNTHFLSNNLDLRYRLRERSDIFAVNEYDSLLTATKRINLEELCPQYCKQNAVSAKIDLIVNIWQQKEKNEQFIGTIAVSITIEDKDDNLPEFENVSRPYEIRLKENRFTKGKVVELPRAIDRDVSPNFAQVHYKLEKDEDDPMALLNFDFDQTGANPRLILRETLDYEKKKSYSFYLISENTNKISTRSPFDTNGSLRILINVINENDVEPRFDKTLYELKIPENTPIGEQVFKLSALDEDSEDELRYQLDVSSEIDQLPFEINEDGTVRVSGKLDFEQRSEYLLPIRVSDGDYEATTKLVIQIIDLNDELPKMTLTPTKLIVKENENRLISIGQVTITDADNVRTNGHIKCIEPAHLINEQPLKFMNEHFQQNEVRYQLQTNRVFDREDISAVKNSILICWDGVNREINQTSLTATLTIPLYIEDVNDNSPVFTMKEFLGSIIENNQVGFEPEARIIQVNATDRDSEANGEIRYSLEGSPSSNLFEIDEKSGWIYAARKFDREINDYYEVTVLATDGFPESGTHNTASTIVKIKILDENDDIPQFRGPMEFQVAENLNADFLITTLSAEDRDLGVAGEVEFTLIGYSDDINSYSMESSNSAPPFYLNKNGSLFTSKPLDRERMSQYCMDVKVQDKDVENPLASTRRICVIVLDENDNSPQIGLIEGAILNKNDNQFDLPTSFIASETKIVEFSVREMPGVCVMVIHASDEDSGVNKKLTFDFDFQSPSLDRELDSLKFSTRNGLLLHNELFRIDFDSGRFTLAQKLHAGYVGNHSLILIVSDEGSPPRRTEERVILELVDTQPKGDNLCGNSFPKRLSYGFVDTKNIVIVIVLSAISAFLAAVLISAILCMLRPCQKRSRISRVNSQGINGCKAVRTNGSRFHPLDPSTVYVGPPCMGMDEPSYLSGIHNGIISNGMILNPQEKIIGIDPSEVGIPIATQGADTIYGSLQTENTSTTYRLEPLADHPTWNGQMQRMWNPLTIDHNSSYIPVSIYDPNCSEPLEFQSATSAPSIYDHNGSICAQNIEPGTLIFQSPVVYPRHHLPNQYVEMSTANVTPTLVNVINQGSFRTNASDNGQTLGANSSIQGGVSMEEQRSDSGRGASDEETQQQIQNANSLHGSMRLNLKSMSTFHQNSTATSSFSVESRNQNPNTQETMSRK